MGQRWLGAAGRKQEWLAAPPPQNQRKTGPHAQSFQMRVKRAPERARRVLLRQQVALHQSLGRAAEIRRRKGMKQLMQNMMMMMMTMMTMMMTMMTMMMMMMMMMMMVVMMMMMMMMMMMTLLKLRRKRAACRNDRCRRSYRQGV